METLADVAAALTTLAAKLRPLREDTALANDMFEAAADWANFGQVQAESPEEENWDLTGRMMQEEELFESISTYYGRSIEENPDYVKVMELGARLIEACKKRKIHPDGRNGILKVLRETFAFLTTDFGLQPGSGFNGAFEYGSDKVAVSLDLPRHGYSSCWLKQTSDPSFGFMLEELLFMNGMSASLALPPDQEFSTETELQAWFSIVADVLRRYGSDLLADRPGAFERLAKSAAEHERLINEENERLYGSGVPGQSGAG